MGYTPYVISRLPGLLVRYENDAPSIPGPMSSQLHWPSTHPKAKVNHLGEDEACFDENRWPQEANDALSELFGVICSWYGVIDITD